MHVSVHPGTEGKRIPCADLSRTNNAGENKCLEKRLRNADWKLHVTVE